MKEESKLSHDLVDAIVGFPKYMVEYVGGLFYAILTDIFITTLTIGAIAAGFATTWISGLTIFFIIYAIARVVGNHASATAVSGGQIASSIAQHALAVRETTLDPSPVPNT